MHTCAESANIYSQQGFDSSLFSAWNSNFGMYAVVICQYYSGGIQQTKKLFTLTFVTQLLNAFSEVVVFLKVNHR